MGAGNSGDRPREGDRSHHDVSNVQYYMRGVHFPAEKDEVAATAESNGAPQDMVAQIRNANTERFDSAEEVMQALQSGLDRG
jgi:hypothetical protein